MATPLPWQTQIRFVAPTTYTMQGSSNRISKASFLNSLPSHKLIVIHLISQGLYYWYVVVSIWLAGGFLAGGWVARGTDPNHLTKTNDVAASSRGLTTFAPHNGHL